MIRLINDCFNPPTNSAVVKMNWTDNKYISPELIAEKDDLKARDYDKYLWVWEVTVSKF